MNSLDLRRERNRNRRHKKTLNEELIAEELNCFQNYNVRN